MAQSEEKQSSQKYPDHITTNITYNNDTGKRYHIEMPNGSNGAGKFIMATNILQTKVKNGRDCGCMLSSHGFQIVPQKTSLSTSDFYENPKDIIRSAYYKEIEDAVKTMTGAAFVKAVHHQVRNSGVAPKGATESVGPAAHAAHCDYTPHGGFQTIDYVASQCPKDGLDYSKGRIAMINVWRNISDDAVIHDDHLAVCDGRSVVAPDDYLKYDYVSPEGHKSESFYLNAARQPFHKWYYFPGMHKDELLVFMQFDSDWQNASRHTFHSAVKDPTAGPQAPSRESIEVRLIAFFPKHTPNTIPQRAPKLKGQALVEAAVKGLFDAIKAPQMWPTKYRREFAQNLRSKDIGQVIKEMVTGSANGGFHHLGGSTAEEQEEVVAALTKRAEEWKEIAMDHFTLDDAAEDAKEDAAAADEGGSAFVDADTAVEAMRKSVSSQVVQYWPAAAKQGVAQMLRAKPFREVVESLVRSSADGGHNNLGGATQDQMTSVVDALMEDAEALKEEMMANFPESG